MDRDVLGVAWDGTGFGDDGSIWGGEFFVGRPPGMARVACLRPFVLPGGEIAIRQPWRVAVALALQVAEGQNGSGVSDWLHLLQEDQRIGPAKLDRLMRLVQSPRFAPTTTSVGRLFDAAAVIILNNGFSQFDGQPAMFLEAAADPSAEGSYPFPLVPMHHQTSSTGDTLAWQLDWRPLVDAMLIDRANHVEAWVMAMRFHRALAGGIQRVHGQFPHLPVVLGGGVFQNRLLVELVANFVPAHLLGLPGTIPSNDGGLAAGQLMSMET
jgi:hydrogenase maturation protein HypF